MAGEIRVFGKQKVTYQHIYLSLCAANMVTKILEPVSSTSRRGARAAYHDEYPRDFDPRIAYTVS